MAPIVPLTYYSIIILAASVFGGMLPLWFRLTHRGMQVAVSFVAAMMFGVGMLHMLPHALSEAHAVKASADEAVDFTVMMWVVAGWLTMFFIERFFCYHHHDLETDAAGELHELHEHEGECGHDHGHHHHDITWSGAALGLGLHSVMNGIALAASVEDAHGAGRLAGLGVFLAVVLHKPFDAMTIATLMAKGGWSIAARCVVNGLFALAVPIGVALFYLSGYLPVASTNGVAYALAFSAGVFLCISMSDLLPELQFHHHDRLLLSLALLAGLAVAFIAGQFESAGHTHLAPSG